MTAVGHETGITIHNTLTGKKEPFLTLEPGRVKMYVCGVTVYDLCHIGHARSYIAFDVIQRYLRWRGLDVTFVRNFTDVDDKIIKRANERGVSAEALSQQYIAAVHEDMGALGVGKADVEPLVSTHIPQIITVIDQLIARGHAYAAHGDVYFDVPSFSPYGALSKRPLDELQAGARVEVDERKRTPADFALWKAAKPGEPFWESPWGPGRPGWHIECSAMSCTHLGEQFDLHGGGMDLIFPHHENEIAQSHGATGIPPARYWTHNGFVNVDDEKMSKSLGNFFTIREVLKKYHPQAVRLFMLTTHYRNFINYTMEALEEATRRITYLYDTLQGIDQALAEPGTDVTSGPLLSPEVTEHVLDKFRGAMDDDFNTCAAIGQLSESIKLVNVIVRMKKTTPGRARTLARLRADLTRVAAVLGVVDQDPSTTLAELRAHAIARCGIDEAEVAGLIAARKDARERKDWPEADRLRGELTTRGIEVMDTPQGTTWRPALGAVDFTGCA